MSIKIRNIFCVGRNYREHAVELKNEIPTSPIIFTKPTTAVSWEPREMIVPPQVTRLDPEAEIVISRISGELQMAIGIDWTARNLQEEAKKKGLPWTMAKGLPGFASLGKFVPFQESATLTLQVNGTLRQQGSLQNTLFSVKDLLSYLETTFLFAEGDILFTGTPHGVGPVQSGDELATEIIGTPSRLHLKVR